MFLILQIFQIFPIMIPQTTDEKKVLADQAITGKIMDAYRLKERFLVDNKDMVTNDDSYMLYRLPLSEVQMKTLYAELTK